LYEFLPALSLVLIVTVFVPNGREASTVQLTIISKSPMVGFFLRKDPAPFASITSGSFFSCLTIGSAIFWACFKGILPLRPFFPMGSAAFAKRILSSSEYFIRPFILLDDQVFVNLPNSGVGKKF